MEVKTKPAYQRYPKYKDTGIKWLGEIPAHWEIEKGKWLFKKVERPIEQSAEIITCFRDGHVTLRKNRRTDGFTNAIKEHGYQGVKKGDLVIHAMDGFAGAIGVSDSNGKSSPVYSVLTPRYNHSVNQFYYAYLLRNLAHKGLILSLAKGIRERSTDFRYKDLGKLYLNLPPKPEQTRIANFLDRKCEQIDKAIARKERLIELLKERRQIIIQNAVTQGLNPNVKLKDSGVEWIGKIPEHWEVKPLKFIAFLKSGETISYEDFTEDGYPVYGGNGFRGYTTNYTNEGEHLLIGRQGALCGNINYAKGKFYASEHAIVVYPLNNDNILWLGESINVSDLNRLSQSAAQPGIAVNIIKNEQFPYPPLKEQYSISRYIENQSTKITKAINYQQQQIQKLKEYKTVLIDHAVTGKVKVTEKSAAYG